MSFDTAFHVVLGQEGGYVNDPRDPGGETKYGISKRAYPLVDIASLTVNDARVIYRFDYWDKIKGDSLPAAVALAVFDCAVNQGTSRAIRLLQTALGVKDDGSFGPVTLKAATSANPAKLLERFMADRALHYASLSTFGTFGRGWMRRLFHVHAEALSETRLP